MKTVQNFIPRDEEVKINLLHDLMVDKLVD